MEEFWKDISLNHQRSSDYFSTAVVFQDFFAKPIGDHPSPPLSAPASSFLRLSSGKRARENGDSSIDQKHERMIRNRESAARSRARKHAYTHELELEVARLQEENGELRRQQQTMLFFADTTQLPRKKKLYRTLTAPF